MESNYDENLLDNPFFQSLTKDHTEIFEKAIKNKWIICIPCRGSLKDDYIINEADISGHILVPNENDDTESCNFHSLNGYEIKRNDRVITSKLNEQFYKCLFHFEETFYVDKSNKYTVWCIEKPLTSNDENIDTDIKTVSNLGDCINFLWTQIDDKNILHDIDLLIELYENNLQRNNNDEKDKLIIKRNIIEKLYMECVEKLLSDTKIQGKSRNNLHYLRTIKISIESYILYGLRNYLPSLISENTLNQDAELNKIINNIFDLELKDLDVLYNIDIGIARGKLELSRIDNFFTVLGKIGCLKRTVRYLTEGLEQISSDDLLPILIFIVIKSNLPNWISQLVFIKQFRFSSDVINDADEIGFLIASLEAAIEHVKSGVLNTTIKKPIPFFIKFHSNESQSKININHSSNNNINQFFLYIQQGDLNEIQRILNKELQSETKSLIKETNNLCHPLCRCETCELNFTNDQINWPSVKTKDDRGRTGLHIASFCGHVTVVDYLLINHSNPNEPDVDGLTPLHGASSRGHQHTVLLLLHANADPKIIDNRGNTCLHLATDHGHEACVKAILYFSEQMGIQININCSNITGNTPLHYASKWGFMSIVEILLEYGANPHIANKYGQTPLSIAHSTLISEKLKGKGNVLSFESIHHISTPIKKQSVKKKNKGDEVKKVNDHQENDEKFQKANKLLTAIKQGDIRLACYYLGLEGPLIKPNDDMPTLCHPLCDCDKCHSNSVNSMVPTTSCSKGTTPSENTRALKLNIANSNGETALHIASANDLVDLVQILLDAGANVNLRTNDKFRTPLHLACLNNNIKVVKLLLNCCTSNVNSKDYVGDTPLHLSVRNKNSRIVELLLRHGSDINARNFKGATPLDEINQMNVDENVVFESNSNIIKILQAHDANAH